VSFDWKEYLELAEGLHASPDVPGPVNASLRAAVSRAYYAALHSARVFAEQEGFHPSDLQSIHQSVPRYFRHERTEQGESRKIAKWLDDLRGRRIDADYEDRLRRELTPNQTLLAIETARYVLNALDSLESS